MARTASAQTLYIRSLVDANETVTFKDVEDKLVKAGFTDVTPASFSVIKSVWLKTKSEGNVQSAPVTAKPAPKHKVTQAKPAPKHKVTVPSLEADVNVLAAALKFVNDNGGTLKQAKENLAKRKADLERDESLVAAFMDLATQVKAAS